MYTHTPDSQSYRISIYMELLWNSRIYIFTYVWASLPCEFFLVSFKSICLTESFPFTHTHTLSHTSWIFHPCIIERNMYLNINRDLLNCCFNFLLFLSPFVCVCAAVTREWEWRWVNGGARIFMNFSNFTRKRLHNFRIYARTCEKSKQKAKTTTSEIAKRCLYFIQNTFAIDWFLCIRNRWHPHT